MSRVPDNFLQRPFARNWVLWGLCLLLGRGAVLADQSVTLTWSPSPDTNAVGYNIYYGGASGDYTNTVFVGGATTVTISGLSDGATLSFRHHGFGFGAESAFSNEAIYDIPAANTTSDVNLPPTLDPIANLTLYQNAGLQTVNLTGIGAGSTRQLQYDCFGGFQRCFHHSNANG